MDPYNIIFSENRDWLIYPYVDESRRQRVKNAGINELIRVIKYVENNPKELKNKFMQIIPKYSEDISNFKSLTDIIYFIIEQSSGSDELFGLTE